MPKRFTQQAEQRRIKPPHIEPHAGPYIFHQPVQKPAPQRRDKYSAFYRWYLGHIGQRVPWDERTYNEAMQEAGVEPRAVNMADLNRAAQALRPAVQPQAAENAEQGINFAALDQIGQPAPLRPPTPATASGKVPPDDFYLYWSESLLPGNCGMRILNGFNGYKRHYVKTPGGFPYARNVTCSIEELWAELDKKFALKDTCVGQVLITDKISSYESPFKPDQVFTTLRAVHIVQYILARKLGTVFRCAVTRNPRYADHIIVSWIWIPNPTWLAKCDPKVYNEPKEFDAYTQKLVEETGALDVLSHEQWINDNVIWPPPAATQPNAP